ncbi:MULTISPECIES: Rho-binding antiterminator [Rheinheimera]|uniref:Rho-binding antiterminator n=1 Tax=Rheinheimera marina TaxID=1774958 RepID=A0ABV9JQD2_9GAMM
MSQNINPAILACDLHDHIEIICMRRYPVELHLLDGTVLTGIAADTRSSGGQEFLQLESQGQLQQIPLLQIERIHILDNQAPLQDIWLQQGGSCAL